jgi:DNA polymerase-3 subunit beta
MLDKTSFAVATDPTRYGLNGLFFEPLEQGLMRMTATDGHRLSFMDQEVFLTSPELKRGVIIPRKGQAELRHLLEDAGDTVRMAFDRGTIFVQSNGVSLFVRLIEGEYPDYRVVIPQATEHSVKIPREDLTSALRRVSLLTSDKSKGVKFSIDSTLLTITTNNPELGEAKEEIDIEYNGPAIDIGFNCRYLMDCLPIMKSDSLVFHFKDRLSPGILRESDKPNHTYVIMPMRL